MTGSIIGAAVPRVEDPRFLRGEGNYLPNHHVEGELFMAPVRSPIPHGTIASIDSSVAEDMPGVAAVFTAADLLLVDAVPGARGVDLAFSRPYLARDKVRFAGEVVAVVIATTERQALEAAEMVFADIDPLPVVVEAQAALADDAPVLFDGAPSNVSVGHVDDVVEGLMDGADVVIHASIRQQRLAAVPLEPNSALAIPHDDRIELWAGSQNIFAHRNATARALGVNREAVHAIVPDLGGGFGAKVYVYPEQVLVAAAARKLGRPVRWQETRRDNMIAMTQGRDQAVELEIGATADGRIIAVRADVIANVGAYPLFGAFLPHFTRIMLPGPYDIPKVEVRWRSVVTNTTPVHAYRGAGRPEATHYVERAIDLVAAELRLDPVEVRRRNLLTADRFPHTTATGLVYDSGEYHAVLDQALELAGYDELRAEQQRRRAAGESVQLGVGLATYVEITAPAGQQEWGELEVHDDGSATVRVGTSGHGQGHETAFAQIASALTKIPIDRIGFVQGDTDKVPRGGGTAGSRSLQLGGSAVHAASEEVVMKARAIVADHVEAAIEDIVLTDDGALGVAGVPGSSMSWSEVAALAQTTEAITDEEEPGLAAAVVFNQGVPTFPFGAHVAVVEVDSETGNIELIRHIAVDDAGTVLNPLLIAGQVHGGVAQGAGQALWEEVRYDEDGNPLSGNLTSYLIPTAGSLPSIERGISETPTPHNPLGAKGIGEAATIGSTPAIHNAVIDALAPYGIRHLDMPLTPGRIWAALQEADHQA